ncbi:MAG: dimethyl sulfoxide reductase anchor subunit [Phreatobacter sp.]|uniref:dimethyl sulfoxide reductase anchor subunit family protein n=1 Tax=Phreatobacter sp. TaxID=1966341 RepID=UPI001A5E2F7E|nr:DmsC/YnfH family molybdoenzyme membrane anchor subunit [Phreatobacter sp.]MBL8571824.1 dimethyl sulfoxide reductase anchor subunit [Phreatobacter sp.]
MHPAFSVILFTTASGAGYGLIALTAIWYALGRVPVTPAFGLCALGLGASLVTLGLLASTFHLGHPGRAWRALGQVRSSWLSREGVAAVATYLPLAAFGLGWVFALLSPGAVVAAALLAAVLCAVTVYCTAMIYRSLKPIHQWCNAHVVPVYLALALMTGALALDALLQIWGRPDRLLTALAVLATVLAVILKERYWRFIDATSGASTAGSATGLAGLGTVRLLDPPHTGSNYLMREMGFQVARKHAAKLRRIALALAFALPLALTLLAALLASPLAVIAAVLAVVSALVGVLVERWLFFAEAKHSVTLYYGAASV